MRSFFACAVFLAACGGLAACGDDAPRAANPDAPGGPGDGGPTGNTCGGLAGGNCAANEYCDYSQNRCGAADQSGTCKAKPTACPVNIQNILPANTAYCGCNGQVYSGVCELNLAGTDLNANASCTPPKGRFACGFQLCDLATEYCVHDGKVAADQQYSCVTIPTTCGATPACACLSGERCGNACTGDAAAGLTLTCQ